MRQYQGYDELDDRPARGGNKVKRPRRASLIGGLAVLVGFAAVAVSQRDTLNELANHYQAPFAGCLYEVNNHVVEPYSVALGAAALAVFALTLRRITGRTRAGLPLFALLLAAGAAGTYRYEHSPREVGSPERWVQDNVVNKVQDWWANRHAEPAVPVAAPAPQAQPPAAPTTESQGAAAPVPADGAGSKSTLFRP